MSFQIHRLFLDSLTKYLTSKCPDEHVKHHHMMENVDGTLLQSCHIAPSQTNLGMIFQSGAIDIGVLSIRSTSGHFLDSSLQGLQKYTNIYIYNYISVSVSIFLYISISIDIDIYSRECAHCFSHKSFSEQIF